MLKKIPIIIVRYIQYENYLILLMVLKASPFSTWKLGKVQWIWKMINYYNIESSFLNSSCQGISVWMHKFVSAQVEAHLPQEPMKWGGHFLWWMLKGFSFHKNRVVTYIWMEKGRLLYLLHKKYNQCSSKMSSIIISNIPLKMAT